MGPVKKPKTPQLFCVKGPVGAPEELWPATAVSEPPGWPGRCCRRHRGEPCASPCRRRLGVHRCSGLCCRGPPGTLCLGDKGRSQTKRRSSRGQRGLNGRGLEVTRVSNTLGLWSSVLGQ